MNTDIIRDSEIYNRIKGLYNGRTGVDGRKDNCDVKGEYELELGGTETLIVLDFVHNGIAFTKTMTSTNEKGTVEYRIQLSSAVPNVFVKNTEEFYTDLDKAIDDFTSLKSCAYIHDLLEALPF